MPGDAHLVAPSAGSPATQHAEKVGAGLGIADRRAAHPLTGIHHLRIAQEEIERVARPDITLVAAGAQRRRIVEGRIAGDAAADQAGKLRTGLDASVAAEPVAGEAGL